MGHIFKRVIQEDHLFKVLRALLEEDIPEMHTISLEEPLSEAFLSKKAERKGKYTLEEIAQWTPEDWELEIQLAPEFEEIREEILAWQERVYLASLEQKHHLREKALQILSQKVLKTLRKKTENKLFFSFCSSPSEKTPYLKVEAESLGFSPTQELLLLTLSGILSRKAAEEVVKKTKEILFFDNPYVVLDFTQLEWIERSSLPPLGALGEELRRNRGEMVFICIHFEEKQKIREELPQWADKLFSDRGGATKFFTLTFGES